MWLPKSRKHSRYKSNDRRVAYWTASRWLQPGQGTSARRRAIVLLVSEPHSSSGGGEPTVSFWSVRLHLTQRQQTLHRRTAVVRTMRSTTGYWSHRFRYCSIRYVVFAAGHAAQGCAASRDAAEQRRIRQQRLGAHHAVRPCGEAMGDSIVCRLLSQLIQLTQREVGFSLVLLL